jgi:hypothetical protein
MWLLTFIIRHIVSFLPTKWAKKLGMLLVALLLCFASTWLLDKGLHYTAALAGLLAATTLIAVAVQSAVQHSRQRRYERECEQRHEEAAAARSEMIRRAKTVAIEAVSGVGSSAAGLAGSAIEAVNGVGSSAAELAGSAMEAVSGVGSSAAELAGSAMEAVSGVGSSAAELAGSAMEAVSGVGSSAARLIVRPFQRP